MRLVVFYLLLLVAQGLLAVLIAPIPAPDFFLLAVITLLWRLSPWQLVLIGYGVGLLQDVMGFGVLGVHALALSGGILLASVVRAQLSQAGVLERFLAVLAALLGKWLVITGLLFWLTSSSDPITEVMRVAPPEVALTLILSIWILPWAEALFERSSLLRKELL